MSLAEDYDEAIKALQILRDNPFAVFDAMRKGHIAWIGETNAETLALEAKRGWPQKCDIRRYQHPAPSPPSDAKTTKEDV